MKTGRPMVTDVFNGALEGKKVTVWPSVSGVTNWQHLSFSPKTGMLYINTLNVGMTYEAGEPPKLKPGAPSGPGTVKRTTVTDDPNVRGFLKAVDPLTGKSKWETPYKSPNYSSTMVTASNLVFTGVMTGEFQALDADTGKVLWSFQTPSGIIGQPITWEKDGKQYVTVLSGVGGVYAQRAGDPNLANVPTGRVACGPSRCSTSEPGQIAMHDGRPPLAASLYLGRRRDRDLRACVVPTDRTCAGRRGGPGQDRGRRKRVQQLLSDLPWRPAGQFWPEPSL